MYDQRSHSVIYSDPYSNDTDEDGLNDGVEMGTKYYDADGYAYYIVDNYPDNADSDEDGLSDSEELETHTIYVADSHASATSFMNALESGTDATQYLHAVQVTSNPLKKDTDEDGISDGDELMMGTNPSNSDSDGDHISDSQEAVYGEDPTIFDLTAPVVNVNYINVYKPSLSYYIQYDVFYSVSDPGGVKDASVSKDGGVKQTVSFSLGDTTSVGESTTFATDWVDTIFDEFQATRVDISADDWNGNGDSIMAYHRPSMWGQLASSLGSDNIYTAPIAADLGLLSGATDAAAETPEFAAQVYNDPQGFVNSIGSLANTVTSDPAFLADMIASLPQSIKDKQDLENPYTPGSTLYDSFATGWYSGYISMQLLMTAAGGEALKAITTSEEFVQLTASVAEKIEDFKSILRLSKSLKTTEKITSLLADGAGSFGIENFATVAEKLKTAARQARVLKHYIDIGSVKRTAWRGYEADVGEFLGRTGEDGVSFIQEMDDASLQKMFSLDINDPNINPNDLQQLERVKKDIIKMRINLVKLDKLDDSIDIGPFINNIEILKSKPGISKVVKEVSKADDFGHFKGKYFEVEYSADNPNVIEVSRESGLGKDGKNNIIAPGEIDVIIRESNGDIIGVECKDRRYTLNDENKNEFLTRKEGYSKLIDPLPNGIPDKYKIKSYKVVFKQEQPIKFTDWLTEQGIQWEYYW